MLAQVGRTVSFEDKTKERIIEEQRQRIDELEKSESLRKQAEKTLRESEEK
jgi:hypothetical protein